MQASFTARKILITGAASGIGRLLSLRLASMGAHLILADINFEALESVRQEIEAGGGYARAFMLDVCDTDSFPAFRDRVKTAEGSIDMLINNAGIVFGGSFDKVALQHHLKTYAVNVEGPVALTYTFYTDLVDAPQGQLVNIASASAFLGLPYGATYASSKWALAGFSESIRLEWKEKGYRHLAVTTVCPGFIDTGMFEGVRSPWIMPLLKPEVITRAIIRGIARKSPWVREPFIVKTVDLLKAFFPVPATDYLCKVLGINRSMAQWKGR